MQAKTPSDYSEVVFAKLTLFDGEEINSLQ